ncbi:MAG: galactokinase [Myxococcales bacterium]|nr:galactokinase [Myxococcales bacterium]
MTALYQDFQDICSLLGEKLEALFGPSFEEMRYFFSPGRVNLIGEHIDYCGGLVFPATLHVGTFAAARVGTQAGVAVRSTRFDRVVRFPLDEGLAFREEDGWANYPKGVFAEYLARGANIPPLEIFYHGDIPGGGLSSSASLEVCTALIIEAFSGYSLAEDPMDARKQMAWLTQHAENTFNGVNCGVMDQASVALGREGHGILMDCETLDVSYVPLPFDAYVLMIVDSQKSRTLASSVYNERRAEADEIARRVKEHLGCEVLCKLPVEEVERALALFDEPVLQKRARHLLSEPQRVKAAEDALRRGDIETFGKILDAGHASLAEDYEISGPQIDFLVKASQSFSGCVGARMTGGDGSGGCMIAVVEREKISSYTSTVGAAYRAHFGWSPTFLRARIGPGALEIVPTTRG